MIAASGGDDAGDARRGAHQAIDVDETAPHLECAGGRVILVLHPNRAAGTARELRPCVLRRRRHGAAHESRGFIEFFLGDTQRCSIHVPNSEKPTR